MSLTILRKLASSVVVVAVAASLLPLSAAHADVAGTALQFNGTNQYVTFGTATGLDAPQFTLETWFKRTGAGVGTSTGSGGLASAIPLLTKGRAEAEGSNVDMNYFLGIDATSNKLVADFEEGAAGASPGLNHPITGTTVVTSNAWHHAAATYDGTTWKLYLDGSLEATLAVGQPPRSDSIQHAALATALNSTGVAGGFFQGVLDEARVWNAARTQAQIQATKDKQIVWTQGLVGRWGLNEGTGTTASNSVAGPSGTLSNGPTWLAGYQFPPDAPPAPPANLTATAGDASVSLGWDPNTEPDLAGYNVYRSTSSPVPTTGAPVNGTDLVQSPSLTDTGLTNGTTYHYVVVAVDGANNASPASNEATATPQAPPQTPHAVAFDGTNDYVTFGPAGGLGASQFTLETWFKRTGAGVGTSTGSGGVTAIPLLTKGRAEAEGSNVDMNYFLGIDASSGKLVGDFEEGATGASPGLNHPVTGTTVVTSNAWHHAAATYDGTTWRLYLDGSLEATLAVGQPPRSDSIQHAALATALTSTGVAGGFFQGVLDEARVWKYARTGAQISANRDAEITSAPGLIGRWGMNEGSGTTINDSSGQGIEGALTNGPTWVGGFTPPPPGPDQPVLVAPADGATGVGTSPTLDVQVSDPNGTPMTVTFRGRPSATGGVQTIATDTAVASGSNATATWAGLDRGQTYQWFVTVDNGTATTTGPTWTFTTADGADPVLVGAGDIASCTSTGDEANGAIVRW